MKKRKIFILLTTALILTSCGEKDPCKEGHSWIDATCTEPKQCTVCQQTEGDVLGHTYGEAIVTRETSCSLPGIKTLACTMCDITKEEEIPTKAHTPGEWEITLQPTATTKGKKAQKCTVCNGIVAEEEFEKSAAEIKTDYISNCTDYTYEAIARNPDNYKGKYAHFRGEIIQSIESGDSYTFRVNVTKGSYTWQDTILVTYTKKEASESRLLEDDIVDIYGMLGGTHTYETVMGNEMTIPLLFAEYISLSSCVSI